jgi:hypothetical protein
MPTPDTAAGGVTRTRAVNVHPPSPVRQTRMFWLI